MIHRLDTHRSSACCAFAAVLIGGFAGGCSSHGASHDALTVGSAYAALSVKMKDCEDAKRACRTAADCDSQKLAVCEQDFHSCRDQARAAEEALHEATHACRVAEETCLSTAADHSAEEACHQQHHTCMEALKPPEPPCHAELEACLDAARAADAADAANGTGGAAPTEPPPPPPPPPHDGMAGAPMKPPPPPHHARPESAREAACHDQLRTCMMNEMPPPPPRCEPPPPPHDGMAGAPMEPPPPPPHGTAGTGPAAMGTGGM
jgi:hypothetical protein